MAKKYLDSANLFDYVAYFDSTFIPYNDYFNYAELQLQPNTTYTLSTSYREYTQGATRNTAFIVTTSSGTPTTIGGGLSNSLPRTITTESNGVLKLYKRILGLYDYVIPTKEQFENGEWLMLNTGSTALPYEPYGKGWQSLTPKIANAQTWGNLPDKESSGGSWI